MDNQWRLAKSIKQLFGDINNKYPKSKHLQFMERKKKEKLNWILPCIVKEMPVPNVPLIYTDENEFGMAGYNSDKMSKVIQSPHTSVQKFRAIHNSYGIIRFSWDS